MTTQVRNYAPPTSHQDDEDSLSVERGEISRLRLANIFLRNLRLMTTIPIVTGILVVLFVLLPSRKYSTTVAFAPSASSAMLSQLAGLAARVGLPIPGQDGTQTPSFYADLIQTPTFLRQVALTRYTFMVEKDTLSGDLIGLLDVDGPTESRKLDEAIDLLQQKILNVDANLRTSVVRVGVRTKWPLLSTQIATRILALIDDFNVQSRQFHAEAERNFMQSRVAASEAELRQSEDALQGFLEKNREFRQDPKLLFQHDRLQRDVAMRQQIFATLSEALEQARIEAIRNTPSISIVMPPMVALRADRRHTLPKLLAGLVAGVLLAVFIAFTREVFRPVPTRVFEREEFERLWSAARADLNRVLVPFTRRRNVDRDRSA